MLQEVPDRLDLPVFIDEREMEFGFAILRDEGLKGAPEAALLTWTHRRNSLPLPALELYFTQYPTRLHEFYLIPL